MEYMKQPCKNCPFRNDVKPFLRPERAAELAYAAQNPYSSFTCHKTLEYDDDGDTYSGNHSKECAGFLTIRAQAGEETPEGFEPSWEMCYTDEWDMIQSYEDEYERKKEEAT